LGTLLRTVPTSIRKNRQEGRKDKLMGWDMYAEGPRSGRVRRHYAFRAASKLVVEEAGSVDCFLGTGGLDCSDCAYAMEEMTGHSAWTDWSREQMAERFAAAKLPDEIPGDEKWAYLSAYHFMRVCSELGLAARASY
jgi:hypothetical protein